MFYVFKESYWVSNFVFNASTHTLENSVRVLLAVKENLQVYMGEYTLTRV
jgi:hypothetical protein